MDSPSWLVYKHYFTRRSRGESPEHLFEGYNVSKLSNDLAPSVEHHKNKDDVTSDTVTKNYPNVTLISPEESGVQRAKSRLETEQEDKLEEIKSKEGLSEEPRSDIHNLDSLKRKIKSNQRAAGTTVLKTVSLPKRKRLSTADIRAQLMNKTWMKRKKLN